MAEGGRMDENSTAGSDSDECHVIPAKLYLDRKTGHYTARIDKNEQQKKNPGKVKLDINVKVNGNKAKSKCKPHDARPKRKTSKGSQIQDENVTIDLKFTINVKNKRKEQSSRVRRSERDEDDDDEDDDKDEDEETEVDENYDNDTQNYSGRSSMDKEKDSKFVDRATSAVHFEGRNYNDFRSRELYDSARSDPDTPRLQNKKLTFGCQSGYDSGFQDVNTDRGTSDRLSETDGSRTPIVSYHSNHGDNTSNMDRPSSKLHGTKHVLSKDKKDKQKSQSQVRKNRAQKLKLAIEREDKVENNNLRRRRASMADIQLTENPRRLPRRPSFSNTISNYSELAGDNLSGSSTDDEPSREQLDTLIMLYKLKCFLKQNLPDTSRQTIDEIPKSETDDAGLINACVINLLHSKTGTPVTLPDGTILGQLKCVPQDQPGEDKHAYNTNDGLLSASHPDNSTQDRRSRSPSFRETLEHFFTHGDDPETQRIQTPTLMESVGDMIHGVSGAKRAQTPVDDEADQHSKDPTTETKRLGENNESTGKIRRETVDLDPMGRNKAELIFADSTDIANMDPQALGIELKAGEQLRFMEVIVVDAEDENATMPEAGRPKPRFQPIGILPYSNENEALIDKEISELSEKAGYIMSQSPFITRSLPGSPKVRAKSFNIMRKISGGEYPPPKPPEPWTGPRRTMSTTNAPQSPGIRSPSGKKTSTVSFYKQFYGKTKRQLENQPDEDTCKPIERIHSEVIDQLDSIQFQKVLRGESLEGLGCLHRGNVGLTRNSSASSGTGSDYLPSMLEEGRVFVFPEEKPNLNRSESNETDDSVFSVEHLNTSYDDQSPHSPIRHRRTGEVLDPSELRSSDRYLHPPSPVDRPVSPNRLREAALEQTPGARASSPIIRGLQRMNSHEPDISKLKNRHINVTSSGPVTPRGDFSNPSSDTERDNYDRKQKQDGSGRKQATKSHSGTDLENAFDSMGDDLNVKIDPSKPLKRIVHRTGEDWILKTKQQVQELSINEPETKLQVSNTSSNQPKNLLSPPEGSNFLKELSGGPSVVSCTNTDTISTNARPFKSYSSSDSTPAREATGTAITHGDPQTPFSSYKHHARSCSESDLDSLNSTPFSSPRNTPTFRQLTPQLQVTHSPKGAQLSERPNFNSSERLTYQKYGTKPQTPTTPRSPTSPSPFRSYKSPLTFETSPALDRCPPSPLSLTSSRPESDVARKIPAIRQSPLTPRDVMAGSSAFKPYGGTVMTSPTRPVRGPAGNQQSTTSLSTKDRYHNDNEGGILSPRYKDDKLSSMSSIDSGLGSSLKPDRLDSTLNDVFELMAEENGGIRLRPPPCTDSDARSRKISRQTVDSGYGADIELGPRTNDPEFEKIINQLFEEEDYQSDDETLRQKCFDVFKTAHHRDTVYSEFRKLLRFKRRNSLQNGPSNTIGKVNGNYDSRSEDSSS